MLIHFPVGEGGREGRGAEWSPLSLARYSVKLAQCPALLSKLPRVVHDVQPEQVKVVSRTISIVLKFRQN